MADLFPIIDVPAASANSTEAMGTKRKFWYFDSGAEFLFKQATPATGEDWAEKIASELCELVGLPHADYDLALCEGKRGCVSPKFVPEGMALFHGNEILLAIDPNYPATSTGSRNFYRVSQHRLDVVSEILRLAKPPLGWTPPPKHETGSQIFAGYVLFDAWIGNSDRHHENWALIIKRSTAQDKDLRLYLSPTYDHASSLGRNESDAARRMRLQRRDPKYTVEAYATKCRSAFFDKVGDSKAMTTFQAAEKVAGIEPVASADWIEAIANVSLGVLEELFARIPPNMISPTAIEFAIMVLQFNRNRLLSILEKLK